MDIQSKDLFIPAANNWQLAAALLRKKTNSGPVIMISGAAGVPHDFYKNFALYLIEHGAHAVVTYDYRGMGKSSGDQTRWPELRMKDWALLDFVAVTEYLSEKFPEKPLVGLGHSYGGQALGLSGVSDKFSHYGTVATMSGYWRDLGTPYSVWFQTQIFAKAIAKIFGHVPKKLSVGEAFPRRIMLDWADWIKQPDYFFSDPDLPEVSRFKDVNLPLLSVGLDDDPWGNHTSIGKFMSQYTSADLRQHWIEPTSSGKIGHLGFFSRRHKSEHWPVVADFLLSKKWPQPN